MWWKKLSGDKWRHSRWWKGVFLSSCRVLLEATPPIPLPPTPLLRDMDELERRRRDKYEAWIRPPHSPLSPHPPFVSVPREAIVSLGRPGCETRRIGFILNLQGPQSHSFPSKWQKKTSETGRKFWETTINSTLDVKSHNKFSERLVCLLVEPNNIQDAVRHSRPWNCGTNPGKKATVVGQHCFLFFLFFLYPLSVGFTQEKKEMKRKKCKQEGKVSRLEMMELPKCLDEDDDDDDLRPPRKENPEKIKRVNK